MGGLGMMAVAALIFVLRMLAIVFGASGNATVMSFVLMFVCGTAAGWQLDRLTRGRWQLYRAVRNWRTPFALEMTLIALGSIWYFVDAALLMRSPAMEVTVPQGVMWVLLTAGIGASFSRAIAERKQTVSLEKLK